MELLFSLVSEINAELLYLCMVTENTNEGEKQWQKL